MVKIQNKKVSNSFFLVSNTLIFHSKIFFHSKILSTPQSLSHSLGAPLEILYKFGHAWEGLHQNRTHQNGFSVSPLSGCIYTTRKGRNWDSILMGAVSCKKSNWFIIGFRKYCWYTNLVIWLAESTWDHNLIRRSLKTWGLHI